MILFPAVDIHDGKCVRLRQGKLDEQTIYGDPVAMAKKWEAAGAQYLHIVDLDGAFTSESKNLATVEEMVKSVAIPIQLGGGIRTLADIEKRLSLGVSRVIIGTTAVKQPEVVAQAVREFGSKIAVGIDARDGKVLVRGWVEDSGLEAVAFAGEMKALGVETVIYTDISRDGMLEGPNVEATREMVSTGLQIIGSGGVGTLEHIRQLKEIGVYGVIVGKALYAGTVNIEEALKLEKQ